MKHKLILLIVGLILVIPFVSSEEAEDTTPPTTFRNLLIFQNGVTKVRHWIMTHSDNNIIRRWRMKG